MEIHAAYAHAIAVILPQPMHDGFHLATIHSSPCKELDENQVGLLWDDCKGRSYAVDPRHGCKGGMACRRHGCLNSIAGGCSESSDEKKETKFMKHLLIHLLYTKV